MAEGEHTVVTNRRARHEFEVLERLEAGLALMGTEVKSLRAGKVVIRDAYATEKAASCGSSTPRSSRTRRATARTTSPRAIASSW